jgi:serine/threonine protein kinase
MARQKRNSWMRSSVVRRAAAVVDAEVAALCEKSPFLNSLPNNTSCVDNDDSNNNNDIAFFHRLEIQLGKALGRGGFAEVYTVAAFDIADGDEDEDDAGEQLRQACKASARSSTGRPNYAIKFLRKKLLSNTQEFQNAAIDLAVETKYLAALSHPNIIKVRGLARGGTAAFRTGKHDDFFLIMDHLQETLEHRLQRWQNRHSAAREDDLSLSDSANTVTWSKPPQHYYRRALHYAHQIADALAYLHDKAIVYR